jgi:hypothetical protein
VPVVGEVVRYLGRLPHPRSLERGVVVLGPGDSGLQDDLARLPAGVVAGGAVGLDHVRGHLRVAHRPDSVAEPAGHHRRLGPECRDVEGRAPLAAGVEIGGLGAKEAPLVVEPLAVEEAADDLEHVGSGESLNESPCGMDWPPVGEQIDRMEEAQPGCA